MAPFSAIIFRCQFIFSSSLWFSGPVWSATVMTNKRKYMYANLYSVQADPLLCIFFFFHTTVSNTSSSITWQKCIQFSSEIFAKHRGASIAQFDRACSTYTKADHSCHAFFSNFRSHALNTHAHCADLYFGIYVFRIVTAQTLIHFHIS